MLCIGIAKTEITFSQIGDFLGVKLPSEFSISENDVIRLLDKTQLEELIIERSPFFFIDKAVAVNDLKVWAVATMTEARSDGHFPGKPIVPLIELCKATAQAGIILTALQGQETQTPIAISAGPSKALAKNLIEAPVCVLVCVKLILSRMRLHFVDGVTYIQGVKVGSLNKIVYTLVERAQLQKKSSERSSD